MNIAKGNSLRPIQVNRWRSGDWDGATGVLPDDEEGVDMAKFLKTLRTGAERATPTLTSTCREKLTATCSRANGTPSARSGSQRGVQIRQMQRRDWMDRE
jgi:hypothetical protein